MKILKIKKGKKYNRKKWKKENPSNANKNDEINNIVKNDNKDNSGDEVFKEKSREKILLNCFYKIILLIIVIFLLLL